MSAHREKNVRGVLGLLIVLNAFGVFLLFILNKEKILSGNYQLFFVLVALGFMLLTYLFFLSGNIHPAKSKVKGKKSSKKK